METLKETGKDAAHKYRLIDESAYVTYFGGGVVSVAPKAYGRCAELFLQRLDSRISQIENDLLVSEDDDIRLIAHQLKSGFRMLGAKGLGGVFEEIEHHPEDKDQVKRLLATVLEEKETFVKELKQFVEQIN